tara:strand:- start:615 stop:887 length:273 start_codon:yes stop_codon:yes gene_type:complete
MAAPDMKNGNLRWQKEHVIINAEDHLTGALYLNIENPELRQQLLDYYGKGGGPSFSVQKKTDSGYEDVLKNLKVFVNTPYEPNRGGGFDR